jgi:ubiquinone biosynthesis monooxygenase Coq7
MLPLFHSSSRFSSRLARRFTLLDAALTEVGRALQVLSGAAVAQRPYPAESKTTTPPTLTAPDQRQAAGLMRVNHVGEICAQALYRGQALGCPDPEIRILLQQAAAEEVDHLAWCQRRLTELNSRPSFLNPFWYAGAFSMGLLASRTSVTYNLGFMAETEHQVQAHLARHLKRLPPSDVASRQIVEQMRQDEINHKTRAEHAGAVTLPWPVPSVMRILAKAMTTTAYWV